VSSLRSDESSEGKTKARAKTPPLPLDMDCVEADPSQTLEALDVDQRTLAMELSRIEQHRARGAHVDRSIDLGLQQKAVEVSALI
jgi:hypothetical protein